MSSSRESCRALAIARPRHLNRSTVLFPAAFRRQSPSCPHSNVFYTYMIYATRGKHAANSRPICRLSSIGVASCHSKHTP